MRVHPNQLNPNAQLDAMYAAQKAAAKREADRTRKKLTDFASAMAGEAEVEGALTVTSRDPEGEPGEEQSSQHRRPEQDSDRTISDWA